MLRTRSDDYHQDDDDDEHNEHNEEHDDENDDGDDDDDEHDENDYDGHDDEILRSATAFGLGCRSLRAVALVQSSGCICHSFRAVAATAFGLYSLRAVSVTAFGLWLPQPSGCGFGTVFGLYLSQLSGCGCHSLRAVALGCICHSFRAVGATAFGLWLWYSRRAVSATAFGLWLPQPSGCGIYVSTVLFDPSGNAEDVLS